MSKLVGLVNRQKASDLTRAQLLPALGKLCVQVCVCLQVNRAACQQHLSRWNFCLGACSWAFFKKQPAMCLAVDIILCGKVEV